MPSRLPGADGSGRMTGVPGVGEPSFRALSSSTENLEDQGEFDAPIRFRRQPRLLLAERRISYRLALLALILSRFHKNTGSIAHLNLLFWAMRSERSRSMLLAWWAGRRFADTVTERTDPSLQVTLNLALSHELVGIGGNQKKRVALTSTGAALANSVDAEEDLMVIEKNLLSQLGILSDSQITRRLGSRISDI
jgi:hypothetical protein